MRLEAIPWIVLFLPLLAAAIITLFTQRDRKVSTALSVCAVVVGFILSVIFIGVNGWTPATAESSIDWLSVGDFQVDFGIHCDPLSLMMLLIVTGVASLIHIYSIGYMADDRSYTRFFACLSFFTFSMLGIVLATNFLQLFIFWELVGVSSYMLIGFWYERPSAADAAKKAFVTNRLGDFGFLLGILMIWAVLHSLNIAELRSQMAISPHALGSMATAAALLIFCGAAGKSAQFPFHVWLPDAMEGPTPVSALIHAATMVAAGVYMLCRVFFVLNAPALQVIAYVGGFTALMAAVIAVQQDDIKRILAYSTLSQLGYMVMAVGLAGADGPTPAMFHLTTHAFFKALLFLGAGSVILAVHHEQNIWKMGGLIKKTPVTFWTFLAGTLALSGMWPFAGSFSKDGILSEAAAAKNYVLLVTGVLAALLTSFYMFRLVYVAFLGRAKSDHAEHAHESPGVMAWPLRILAVFSLIGGVIGIEGIYAAHFAPEAETAPASFLSRLIEPFVHDPVVAGAGLGVCVIGWWLARSLYAGAERDPLPEKLGALSVWMRNRFYFDEFYESTVIRLHDFLSAVAGWIDRVIIDGCCVGIVRGGTDLTGRALRLLQTGNLQTYAFLFALGVAIVLHLVLAK